MHPGGERRTYWATETRYRYNGGSRRDCVEVDLGQGRSGLAEITAFIKMYGDIDRQSEGVLVRWMDKSSLSTIWIGTVLFVPIRYRPIIVCGNGRRREETDRVSAVVDSGTTFVDKGCGVMLINRCVVT